jgi:hypothetical protein
MFVLVSLRTTTAAVHALTNLLATLLQLAVGNYSVHPTLLHIGSVACSSAICARRSRAWRLAIAVAASSVHRARRSSHLRGWGCRACGADNEAPDGSIDHHRHANGREHAVVSHGGGERPRRRRVVVLPGWIARGEDHSRESVVIHPASDCRP